MMVSWVNCQCPPAVAARGGYAGVGHQVVYCRAEPGCKSVCYKPRLRTRVKRVRGAVGAAERPGAPRPRAAPVPLRGFPTDCAALGLGGVND